MRILEAAEMGVGATSCAVVDSFLMSSIYVVNMRSREWASTQVWVLVVQVRSLIVSTCFTEFIRMSVGP